VPTSTRFLSITARFHANLTLAMTIRIFFAISDFVILLDIFNETFSAFVVIMKIDELAGEWHQFSS